LIFGLWPFIVNTCDRPKLADDHRADAVWRAEFEQSKAARRAKAARRNEARREAAHRAETARRAEAAGRGSAPRRGEP